MSEVVIDQAYAEMHCDYMPDREQKLCWFVKIILY